MRCILVLAIVLPLFGAGEEVAIKKVMNDQAAAWNRGDLNDFMKAYENSPAITFVGQTVSRGYAAILARYEKNYGDKSRMGKLFFSEIEVKMLGKEHALVIGKYALDRTPEGGGPASGRYSLIAHKTKEGWKFIHDHTSN